MTRKGSSPQVYKSRMWSCYRLRVGKPLATRNRRELIASLRPNYLKHLRADNGDLPERWESFKEAPLAPTPIHVAPGAPGLRILP